jgi:hypothetical protein
MPTSYALSDHLFRFSYLGRAVLGWFSQSGCRIDTPLLADNNGSAIARCRSNKLIALFRLSFQVKATRNARTGAE